MLISFAIDVVFAVVSITLTRNSLQASASNDFLDVVINKANIQTGDYSSRLLCQGKRESALCLCVSVAVCVCVQLLFGFPCLYKS